MDFDDTALDDATYGRSPAPPVTALVRDPAADQTERQLVVLTSLVEMGHDVALVMKNRVVYAAVEGKTDDKAVKGYALAAKTVQQIILLYREIKENRETRRANLVSQRKIQAKQTLRGVIDRPDPPGTQPQQQRTEKIRAVQRVQLDAMFKTLDDDLVEGISVAELVERACRLFGLAPDPALRWPEWEELRGETPPEPPAGAPAQPAETQPAETQPAETQPSGSQPAKAQPTGARPAIPARFAGASALGLTGRAPPATPFAGPRERAPP